MGRAFDPHLVLDFRRSARADEFSIALPDDDTEYHLSGRDDDAVSVVELRWSPRLREHLEALREHAEDGDVGERAALVGRILAEFVSAPAWSAAAPRVIERGHTDPLFLTVRSKASELYLLPWELLTVGPIKHVGALSKLLLRYEVPGSHTRPRFEGLSQTRRGRVILAWSAAGGKVDARRHVELIKKHIDASAACFDERDRAFDVLEHASCKAIERALSDALDAREPVAVLHIVCHGHGSDGTFGLALNDDSGGVDVVSPSRLQMLLGPYAGVVRLVVISACDGGNAGAVGAHLGSVAQEVHRAGFGAVIASRFPLSWRGAYVFATELYATMLSRGETLEAAFLAARSALLGEATYDWASLQLYARDEDGDATYVFNARPYRGLAAFAPEHARFFAGRDDEITELAKDLEALIETERPRLLVVSGASGTGKSSLVLGGAIPRWRSDHRKGGFAHVVVRPGAAPAAALAQVKESTRPLRDACRRLVVVVDQFEEVFTHRDSDGALALARGLWELASEPDSPLCVIVTMRLDFLARCNELVIDDAGLRFDKVACDPAHQVLVAQMSPEQLVSAIEDPARAAGVSLEQGLAREIVRDVEAAPGALPLMSHALLLLWLQRRGALITRAAYAQLGSVQGALDKHAEQQLGALRDGGDEEVARRLMLSLVQVGAGGAPDTRRRRTLKELSAMFASGRERFDRVLKHFVDARLLVTGGEGGAQTVEVAHEALIRSWKTYTRWIDANRTRLARLDQLEGWARDWKGAHGAVLQGSRLGYAEEVEKEARDDLSTEVLELLTASRDARQRAVEAATRARRVRAALIAAAFVTLSAFSGAAVMLWRRAEAARRDAEEKHAAAIRSERAAIASEAVSRAAELRARSESSGQELENMASAVELRDDIMRRLGHAPMSVDGVLFQNVATVVRRPPLRADLSPTSFVISPDGARIAATTLEAAYVWDTRDARLVATCASREQGPVWGIDPPVFTRDSSRLVVSFSNGTASSVNARDGSDAIVLGAGAPMSLNPSIFVVPTNLLVASDGSLALTDDVVRDTRHGAALLTLPHDRPQVLDLRADDAAGVVTLSIDGVIRRWSRDGRADTVAQLEASRGGEIHAARFSPDGSRVVTVSADMRRGAVSSALDGARIATLEGRLDTRYHFTDDGQYFFTRSFGGLRPDDSRGDSRWELSTGRALSGDEPRLFLGLTSDRTRALETSLDAHTLTATSLSTQRRATLRTAAGAIRCASITDGRVAVAIESARGFTHLWTDGDERVLRTWGNFTRPCDLASVTADGASALVRCGEEVVLRDLRSGELVAPRSAHPELGWAESSPDGRFAITVQYESAAALWDLSTGELRATNGWAAVPRVVVDGAPSPSAFPRFAPVSFARDAPLASALTVGPDAHDLGELTIWNLDDARLARTLRAPEARGFAHARFLRGGALFAAMGDGSIRLYDARTGAMTRSTPCDENEVVVDIAVSPDGARAFSAHERDTLRTWDGRTGALISTTRLASNHIARGEFSDDARSLVTSSNDHIVRLWDVSSGRLVGPIHREAGEASARAFSPDGERLATGYADGTVAVWQTLDAGLLAVIPAHLRAIREISFSRDGAHLSTSGDDGAARLWTLTPAELTRAACARLRGSSIWSSRASLQSACAPPR